MPVIGGMFSPIRSRVRESSTGKTSLCRGQRRSQIPKTRTPRTARTVSATMISISENPFWTAVVCSWNKSRVLRDADRLRSRSVGQGD